MLFAINLLTLSDVRKLRTKVDKLGTNIDKMETRLNARINETRRQSEVAIGGNLAAAEDSKKSKGCEGREINLQGRYSIPQDLMYGGNTSHLLKSF